MNKKEQIVMQDLLTVCELAMRLFNEALPKFNWGQSALDANAISLLNTVPAAVNAALEKAKRLQSPLKQWDVKWVCDGNQGIYVVDGIDEKMARAAARQAFRDGILGILGDAPVNILGITEKV